VNLHGYTRFTKDLDLILDLHADNARRAMQALQACGLVPRVPVAALDFADRVQRDHWFEQRNMLVFQLVDAQDPFCSVDVFVRNPLDFDAVSARSVVETIAGVTVRIIGIRDLVTMKEAAGRPDDLRDIAALNALQARPDRET
jgi:hypothetical protein